MIDDQVAEDGGFIGWTDVHISGKRGHCQSGTGVLSRLDVGQTTIHVVLEHIRHNYSHQTWCVYFQHSAS